MKFPWSKKKAPVKTQFEQQAEMSSAKGLPMPEPKYAGKGRKSEARFHYEEAQRAKADAEALRDKQHIFEENARQEKLARERISGENAAWKEYGKEQGKNERWEDYASRTGRTAQASTQGETSQQYRERVVKEEQEKIHGQGKTPSGFSKEDFLNKLPPKERKRYEKEYAKAEAEKAKAGFETWKQGVPDTGPTQYYKQYVQGFTVPKGQTYKDPESGQLYTEGQQVPSHHVIHKVPGEPLTPYEQTQLRNQAELDRLRLDELKGQVASASRERHWGWTRDLAQGIMGGTMAGIGGAAGAIRQGGGPRGQMSMAQRNLVPQPGGASSPLYQINRPSAPIIRQAAPGFNPNTANLDYLRQVMFVPNRGPSVMPTGQPRIQRQAPSPLARAINVTGRRIKPF